MKTLFKTIHGSRLYGTDTPTSDTDWKSVVQLPLWFLLRGNKVSNSVTSTGDSFSTNGSEDTDDELIPIQVLCKDFIDGQTYAVEMVMACLQQYAQGDVEGIDPHFIVMCEELRTRFLTRNVSAMVGYATNQANKYGIKGTRLNSLQKFHKLVDETFDVYDGTVKPKKLMDSQPFLDGVKELVEDDVHINEQMYFGPRSVTPANPVDPAVILLGKTFGYEITFEEAFKRTTGMLKKYGNRAKTAANSEGKDWKAISHALRIIDQACDILTNERLAFPLPKAALYRDIKMGLIPWEEVEPMMEVGMAQLEVAQAETSLPEADEKFMAEFYKWFDYWLQGLYRDSL
ncbi:nucleotidyltransferase [Vibrio phage D479]